MCDSPAGKYEFYGYVHYADGVRLGEKKVMSLSLTAAFTEGENTYLYTGFCSFGDRSRSRAMATVLGPDMLTIVKEPVIIVPSEHREKEQALRAMSFTRPRPCESWVTPITYLLIYQQV